MSVLRSSAVISLFTLGSRLLGFVRDILMANILGASLFADVFFVALRLPNLFRQLLAEGAFNVAFVPMLARTLKEKGDGEASRFANATFAWLLTFVIGFTVFALLFMPFIILLIASGFVDDPVKYALAVDMSRLTFPYLILIVATAFMTGIINSKGRFAEGAAMPMLLNVSFIGCLLILPGLGVQPVWAAAIAVPVGGVLQVALLWWAVKHVGFNLKMRAPHRHEALRPLFKRFLPATIGVGAQQINLLVSTHLASLLATGSISYLFYADRLNQLPLALVGIAIGTALLPHLARTLREDGGKKASRTFEQAFVLGLGLAFAAATGLFLLAEELILVLFTRGAFTLEAAEMTALALQAFVVGLPAYVGVKITASAFYANEDTRTPLKTALVSIVVNLIANLLLIRIYGHVGLALGTAIAAWVNLLLHLFYLRKLRVLPAWAGKKFAVDVLKMVAIVAVMGAALWGLKSWWPYNHSADLWLRLVWLCAVVGMAKAVFAGGLMATGAVPDEVKNRLKRRFIKS